MTKLQYIPKSELDKLPPDQLAWGLRVNSLYMVAKAGKGHLGTSLSSMEAILAARRLMGENDVFIGSKGHDAAAQYSVSIALGTLAEPYIHQFRTERLPGHPTTDTPGVSANCGSLGMGLSKSIGFARSGKGIVYCLLGDGEMMEGQNWEAALFAKKMSVENIIAIVDCNGLSQDGPAFLSIDDIFKMFRGTGWTTVIVKNGNDYQDVENVLIWARRNIDRGPVAILLKTVKGLGISEFAGQAQSHSGPPEDYAGALLELKAHLPYGLQFSKTYIEDHKETPPTIEYTKGDYYNPVLHTQHPLYAAFGEAVREAMEVDDRIVLLTMDTARDLCVYDLREAFPQRVIDCGIAEQNAVSMASALALDGYKPIVATYARFLSRCHEQIYNACTENTAIVYVGSMAGPLPENGPGISHESLDDDIWMGEMMLVYEPETPQELGASLKNALGAGEPTYIRLLQ